MSHSYALVVSHMTMWAGDPTVLHPKFDIMAMLKSVGQFKVQRLYLVNTVPCDSCCCCFCCFCCFNTLS